MGIKTDRVAQSMTRSVIYIEQDSELEDAWDIMEDCGIRHLPIVDADLNLVGILSDRDILLYMQVNDDGSRTIPDMKVSEAMTIDPITCSTATPIYRAASIMIEGKIDSLPVLGGRNELVGLITSSDIMSLLTSHDGGDWSKVIPFEFNLNTWDETQNYRQNDRGSALL